MKYIFTKTALTLATFAAAFLFTTVPVSADTVSTDFEDATVGSVNGYNGWSVTNPNFDQEIVENTYGFDEFGTKVWRLSNKVAAHSFGDQIFSTSTNDEAGETAAVSGGKSGGTRQNHFEASFDFVSTATLPQSGLTVEISPDRGDGARMSRLGIADDSGVGIYIYLVKSLGESDPNGFGYEYLKTNVSRDEVHTLKYVIDVYDGTSNDILTVYLDNVLVYTGTTWEDYYYFGSESLPNNSSRTMDSLLFRVTSGGPSDATGYLFDNITVATSNRPLPLATEVWVNDDVAQNGDGTEASPFNTIAEGVEKVAVGGIVHVAPGAYTGEVVITKALTIESTTEAVLTGSIAIKHDDVVVTGLRVINPDATTTGAVDLSDLMTNGTGELPQMTVTSALNTVVLDIPADTTVTAPGWDGFLHLPTLVPNSSVTPILAAGESADVSLAFSVGSDVPMSFDRGVRLLFPEQKGKRVGYTHDASPLTEITALCAADDQATGDALAANGDCKMDNGADLVVWTKHFTIFATYSSSTSSSSSHGGGRSIGSIGSTQTTTLAPVVATPTVETPATGQVLGAETYVFTIYQTLWTRGHADVFELQTFLNKRGYESGPVDSIYGPITQKAVRAFQTDAGLASDGIVGPLTRAVLNK